MKMELKGQQRITGAGQFKVGLGGEALTQAIYIHLAAATCVEQSWNHPGHELIVQDGLVQYFWEWKMIIPRGTKDVSNLNQNGILNASVICLSTSKTIRTSLDRWAAQQT